MTYIVDGKPVEGVTKLDISSAAKKDIVQEPIKITLDGSAITTPDGMVLAPKATKPSMLEKFIDSVISWAKTNPGQVLIFIAGLFLLRKVVKR